MSYYYKYNFVSPEPIYALVKLELKSYFDTGAIDDLLFPIYTKDCLEKLGKGSYKILPTILNIEDFTSRLPDGFVAVREAWLCTSEDSSYQAANARYHQITTTSTRLDRPDVYCDVCNECQNPDIVKAIYKVTNEVLFQVKRTHLLKPGNISVIDNCSFDCANIGSSSVDTFDIRDNKFVVNFRQGIVYMSYYVEELTEAGYQLIPDNVRVREFLQEYLKYKMFEILCNSATGEEYKQLESKKLDYERKQAEKQVLAEIEMKKETTYQKQLAIKKLKRRLNKYHIS